MFKLHGNHGSKKKGLGHTKDKTTYNPHRKYVDIPTIACAHYGNNWHFKKTCTT